MSFLQMAIILVLVGGVLFGCSSGKETVFHPEKQKVQVKKQATDQEKDRALQHFIDGSLLESKGEHALAVLEFQEALRYDQDPAVYYSLSKNYAALNRFTSAIESGREAVRLAPEKSDYRRNLADVFVGAHEIDSAAAQYETLTQIESGNIEVWFNLARLYQVRKPLKALEVYNTIVDRFGAQWDVLLSIADLENSLGRFENAAVALSKMTEIDPANLELRRSLAQTYVQAKRTDDAISTYRDLIERDPDKIEYRMELAGVYLLKGDLQSAGTAFDSLLAMDSVAVELKLQIGEMYFSRMERDSTLAPRTRNIFEQIRKSHPDDWRAYWFLGAIGAIQQDDSLAMQNFRKVTQIAGWNADGWVYLSSLYLDKAKYDEVVRILEAALKFLPDEYRVNSILGIAYSRLGRTSDAVRVLEHSHGLNPKDLNTISQLALIYDGLKMFTDSDSLYEKGLRLDPENHLLLNNYGYSLSERDLQLDRALDMATRAVAAQPENQSYLDTFGWVYYKLGNYTEAEKYILKAIAQGNPSAVLYEHLGDIYEKMNDPIRAVEQWEIALKLDENNLSLQEKIARTTK